LLNNLRVAYFGLIDKRAQTEAPGALRTDTPQALRQTRADERSTSAAKHPQTDRFSGS
jgi:hypothetical protein